MPQKVDRPRPQQRPEAVSTLPPTLGATRASLRPDAPPARLQPTPRDFARSKSSEAGIGAVCYVLEQRARRNIESAWSPPRQAGLLFDTCRRVAWPLLGRPCSGRRPPSRRAFVASLVTHPSFACSNLASASVLPGYCYVLGLVDAPRVCGFIPCARPSITAHFHSLRSCAHSGHWCRWAAPGAPHRENT